MDEYAGVHAKAGPRLQVIMDLLIRTGQTVSDVLAIRRAELTEEGIRFVQQKTGAKLVVPWTPELYAVTLTGARKQGLNAFPLAGHSSPAQTERYARDREEPLADGPSCGKSDRQGEKIV